jgi:hypothetical protein
VTLQTEISIGGGIKSFATNSDMQYMLICKTTKAVTKDLAESIDPTGAWTGCSEKTEAQVESERKACILWEDRPALISS